MRIGPVFAQYALDPLDGIPLRMPRIDVELQVPLEVVAVSQSFSETGESGTGPGRHTSRKALTPGARRTKLSVPMPRRGANEIAEGGASLAVPHRAGRFRGTRLHDRYRRVRLARGRQAGHGGHRPPTCNQGWHRRAQARRQRRGCGRRGRLRACGGISRRRQPRRRWVHARRRPVRR